MRAPPGDLDQAALRAALAAWDVDAASLAYVALGFGGHHWIARGPGGAQRFVTVDDLDVKPWLGQDRDTTFAGLRAAMETAAALRRAGLAFVVAPLPAADGEVVRRVDDRHTVTVHPWVEGRSGAFGDTPAPEEAARLATMLAELHRATLAATQAPSRGVDVDGRPALDAALAELREPWTGGPLAEPTREWLIGHAPTVRRALRRFDALADRVRRARRPLVVTHGEPHPGNVVHAGGRLLLVDWDTVALAPPERDVRFLAARTPDGATRYEDAAGVRLDPAALQLYRLAWDLSDLAAYVRWFRSPHGRDPNTERAWGGLAHIAEAIA